jgi:hypothetical protein
VFPVHRWDWHLLQWERAKTQDQRDAHRRAFSLALSGNENKVRDDAMMRAYADKADAERKFED